MPVYATPDDAPSDLHRLLLVATPENEHGNRSILGLAKLMKIDRRSIGKWVKRGRVPPERVIQIVEIGKTGEPRSPGGRVKREEFDRFVYNL